VILLLVVAFLGGVLTAFSPCVLPVLPVVVAGGAAGGPPRRPVAIVAGLVVSFTLATLAGMALLTALHLPQDLLNYLGVALLLLLALGFLIPPLGDLIERPFARVAPGRPATESGGLLLGMSLGLVFIPCAAAVLTAIDVATVRNRFGPWLVLTTLAYAVGVGVPLLVLALLARRAATGWTVLRTHAPLVRQVSGAVIGLMAVLLFFVFAFGWTGVLKDLPGASALEDRLESSKSVQSAISSLDGVPQNRYATAEAKADVPLPQLGAAPDFQGISAWFNTPGDRPLHLAGLRGHVVLVDFWTYSCINCQRALPHVEAWWRAYRRDGLVVVGVHSPEFGFEHVPSNVQAAVHHLGVTYPVAVDDRLATWTAYENEYWPAEYLVDQNGQVRHTLFGEGDYAGTERAIRLLLAAGGARHLPPATEVANRTPDVALTAESYLGYDRLNNATNSVVPDQAVHYTLPAQLSQGSLAFGGTWTVHHEEATAGSGARLALHFIANDVYLVLGGRGTVTVSFDGRPVHTVAVSGVPDLYTLYAPGRLTTGQLTLTFSPGVQAYDFTFG
jgi:cytochrome c biogenesis protein CcdA/thiol-disulfide isomerase/thioredoxin